MDIGRQSEREKEFLGFNVLSSAQGHLRMEREKERERQRQTQRHRQRETQKETETERICIYRLSLIHI